MSKSNSPYQRLQAAELARRLAEPRRFIQVVAGARQVGLLTGLPKFSDRAVRQCGSSPKLQVLNTALMSAQFEFSFEEARTNREAWGRLVESAIGAHLANAATAGECELFYWCEPAPNPSSQVR